MEFASLTSIKADTLIAAKRLGLTADQIRFSDKLEWLGDASGRAVLRAAAVDYRLRKVTLYLGAMQSRLNINDVLQRSLKIVERVSREFDESQHPRDEHGRWTDAEGNDSPVGGVEFVSPNVASDLGLKEAVDALSGKQQAALKEASNYIDGEYALKGSVTDAIGAWADGAENTVVDFHGATKWTDWDKLTVTASMKGWLADQKAVLVFQEEPNRKARESIALKGQYPHSIGTINLTVEVNPTSNELRSMAKDSKYIRVLIDGDGNLYAWNANKAIHDQVAGALDLGDENFRDVWTLEKGKLISEGLSSVGVNNILDSLHGNAVLLSFEANGSLESIHKELLSDGLAFHTLVPKGDGATVYAAATAVKDVNGVVDATIKAANHYGSNITYHHGRGEFIGDFSESGSDREQRDRARSIYEQNIRQSPIQDSKTIWQSVRDKWGKADAQAIAAAFGFRSVEWDESEHPRDEDGRWTDAGGAGGADQIDGKPEGGGTTSPPLNPEVVNVGGDQWNKDIAQKLETEYVTHISDLNAIAQQAVGTTEAGQSEDGENSPMLPDCWDTMSNDQQSEAESEYMKNTYEDFYNSEVESWTENEAPLDAMHKVAADFNDGSEDDWARNVLTENFTFKGEDKEDGKIPLAFSLNEILRALVAGAREPDKSSDYKPYLDFNFSDKELDENTPIGFETGQQDLPGIESAKPHEFLTDKQRDRITNLLVGAGEKQANSLLIKGKIDPPSYLDDSVKEFQGESWDQMSGNEKYSWVENYTNIIKDAEEEIEKNDSSDLNRLDQLPEKYDPLNETSGQDYKRTQALASYMSRERAVDLIVERMIINPETQRPFDKEDALKEIKETDRALWNGWKEASASNAGWILQVAAHFELGGRLRDIDSDHTAAIGKLNADEYYKSIGGFEGVKAMVRAKWETTQYLLDKANIQVVNTYRGLRIPPAGNIATDGKIVDFQLMRNGAQSATISKDVAKQFAGDNTILRLQVPRTAILSVPAYGINIFSEKEVVVTGTAWKGWDAWMAPVVPNFDVVPVEHHI